MSSGSYFQKVQVSEPTFSLMKYNFKGPNMKDILYIFKRILKFST
jgi:hypothetical protein